MKRLDLRLSAGWLGALLLALPLLLAACGGGGGTIEGQVLGLLDRNGGPAPLGGARVVARGAQGDLPLAQTGQDGKFRFTNVKRDNYTILVTYGDLRPEQKRVAVTDDRKETVSFMLLPPDIEVPDTPPPLPSEARAPGSTGYYGSGFSPLIWYYLINSPWVYNFPRAPYTTIEVRDQRPVVVIDRTTDPRVSDNNRGYSTYSDPSKPAAPGTKPAPEPVGGPTGTKGEVKPNAAPAAPAGAQATAPAAPTAAAPPRPTSGAAGTPVATVAGGGAQPTAAAPPRATAPSSQNVQPTAPRAAPTAAAPPRAPTARPSSGRSGSSR